MSAVSENKGKIGLVVVLLLVAGGVYWFTAPSRPKLSDTILFVDATTGKMLELDRKALGTLPATNPETGEPTLVPCYRTEDGKVFVSSRKRSVVQQLGEKNQVIDLETLEVRVQP
ncbi:MAG: hypothetical protein HRF50_03335 [Phycisphaerae bacterium]|jgi:hypothetical protein